MNFFSIPDHIVKETHCINLDLVKHIKYLHEDKASGLVSVYVKYLDNDVEFYEMNKSYFTALFNKLNASTKE